MRMTSDNADSSSPHAKDFAAVARRRRIELRTMQRLGKDNDDTTVGSDAESQRSIGEDPHIDPITLKPKPLITGIKRQHRYDPGIRMSRDELKTWRKEARRVRNRESAAASRKRNRERICELEVEVDALQLKYTAALKRIMELESGTSHDSFTPAILRQDLLEMATAGVCPASPPLVSVQDVSPPTSPPLVSVKTVSPPMSPSCTYHDVSDVDEQDEDSYKKYPHIIDMISRPAVST